MFREIIGWTFASFVAISFFSGWILVVGRIFGFGLYRADCPHCKCKRFTWLSVGSSGEDISRPGVFHHYRKEKCLACRGVVSLENSQSASRFFG